MKGTPSTITTTSPSFTQKSKNSSRLQDETQAGSFSLYVFYFQQLLSLAALNSAFS